MSGTMRDLIQGEADVDDEENDESFDEDTGEPISGKSRINGELDDSSEEEEDDDDEEAARAVCSLGSHFYAPFADTLPGSRGLYHR
jgi:transcription elongation factor SPT6